MMRVHTNHRRAEKKSSARAAVRMLRKAGYTWVNGVWQAPFITMTVRPCDIPKLKAELQHAIAKEPLARMRLQPYQETYMRKYQNKANGLHQIAEPGQSTGGCKVEPHPPTRHCMCAECAPSFADATAAKDGAA